MDENGSGESEREKVCHRKRRREIKGGVVVICVQVELVVGGQDPSDVVYIAIFVVKNVVVNGEVREIPRLLRAVE